MAKEIKFTPEEVRGVCDCIQNLKESAHYPADGERANAMMRHLREKLKDTPEEYVRKHPYVYGQGCKVCITNIDGYKYLTVPLPHANRDWTFAAFDYVKNFCKKFPRSHPVHRNCRGYNNAKYIYVEIHE